MAKDTRRAAGTGSIHKKTVVRKGEKYEYWEAQVTIGYDPGTGKQIRKTYTGKSMKEVREKMQAAAAAVQTGDYFEPSKITVAAWFDLWFQDYCGDKKYFTVDQYNSYGKNHICAALGNIKLAKLTPVHIQKFYNICIVCS